MKRLLLALIYAFIALACTISTVPAQMTATPQATVTGTSTPRAAATMTAQPTATPTAVRYTCTVISDALTVRACGGVDCPAIAWLRAGDTITTTQPIAGWIYTGDGWINSIYCEVNK